MATISTANRSKRILVQICATPGYVLLALSLLAFVNTLLYIFAEKVGVVASSAPLMLESNQSSEFQMTVMSVLLMFLFTGVVWYFIGKMIRNFCVWLAKRSSRPNRSHTLITFGGVIVGWLSVALGCTFIGSGEVLVVAAVSAGAISLVSFGLQQTLAWLLHVSLVD